MGRLRPRFKSQEQSRTKRSPADLYDAALHHFLSKRVGPAEDRCRQALTLDPKHADSLHLVGLVHWQTNRLDLAVDLIPSAIRCNPNNREYFLNLGELLRDQDKLDEARKARKVIRPIVHFFCRLVVVRFSTSMSTLSTSDSVGSSIFNLRPSYWTWILRPVRRFIYAIMTGRAALIVAPVATIAPTYPHHPPTESWVSQRASDSPPLPLRAVSNSLISA